MTPKALLSEKYSFSSVNNSSYDILPFEGYCNFINLETYLRGISESESPLENFVQIERSELVHGSRRRELEKVLKKLSALEIPVKEEVGEYLRDQYRRHCRPNTLRQSLMTMDNFLTFIGKAGKVHLEEIVREDLGAWIEHEQDRGLKASTVNMRLRTLKGFIRFLIEKGSVRSEVLSKRLYIKVPNALPRAMDPDDVNKLLGVVKDSRDRAMVLVLLRTGMRIGELLNTLVSEVNLNERKIEIYEAEKTRVGRIVYLSEDAVAALKTWLRKRDSQKVYLFYAQGRNTMTYGGAHMMFKKYLDKAGLCQKGYSLHCLRHTFATDLLNAGMHLECLQPLLGHNSIEMTRRYARLSDKSREEEYFRAMAIIERGELDGYHQLDRELQATPKEKELLTSYGEQLHEYP